VNVIILRRQPEEEGENGLGAEIVVTPVYRGRNSGPPTLSYTTENIEDLIRDWDSGTRLQIGGLHSLDASCIIFSFELRQVDETIRSERECRKSDKDSSTTGITTNKTSE